MVNHPDVVPLSDASQELDDRLSRRFIALDPKGYFLIKVDHAAAELVLEHYGNTIDEKGLAHDSETGEVLSCKGVMDQGNRPLCIEGSPRNRLGSNSLKGKALTRSVVWIMRCIWGGSCRKLSSVCGTARLMCRTEMVRG